MINLNLPEQLPKVKKRLDLLKKNRLSTRRFTVDVASNDYLQALLSSTTHTKLNVKSVSKSISDLNNCLDGNKPGVESDFKLSTLPNMKIKPVEVPVIRAKGPEFIVQSGLEPLVVDISDVKVGFDNLFKKFICNKLLIFLVRKQEKRERSTSKRETIEYPL